MLHYPCQYWAECLQVCIAGEFIIFLVFKNTYMFDHSEASQPLPCNTVSNSNQTYLFSYRVLHWHYLYHCTIIGHIYIFCSVSLLVESLSVILKVDMFLFNTGGKKLTFSDFKVS